MQVKSEEKKKVQFLRKQGMSYNKILEKIPVAKSSVSVWCNEIKLTRKQNQKIENMRRKGRKIAAKKAGETLSKRRKKEIKEIKFLVKKEIRKLTRYQIKIIGAMIYWAEGDKTNGVGITNSDPQLIKFMIYWLETIFKIPRHKLKAYLNIHANQDEKRARKYWSRITKIPLNRFGKTYIKPQGTGHRKNILYNGIIKVKYSNEDLRHRIMTWIEEIYLTTKI